MTEERWQSHGGMLGSENVPTVKHSLELLVEVRMIKDFGAKEVNQFLYKQNLKKWV